MSTNKFISYLLCNKDIIVNLYKLHFLSSHFSFQQTKEFSTSHFPSIQPNTYEKKLNIFHPSTNFLSSHFSTPLTKRTLRVFYILSFLFSFHTNTPLSVSLTLPPIPTLHYHLHHIFPTRSPEKSLGTSMHLHIFYLRYKLLIFFVGFYTFA